MTITDAAKAALEGVTPGPWWKAYDEDQGSHCIWAGGQSWRKSLICDLATNADACFIVWCRENVPALVADVERLQAELAAVKAEPASVRVKPLVWVERDGSSYRQANSAFGQYQISWLMEFEIWQLFMPVRYGDDFRKCFLSHSTLDAAKAAAQADYEARILSAIEPAPNDSAKEGAGE